jgi:3-hydroxyisobutyrate dehydrogenase-like beta-hydroxyacid dehydrogenase
MTTKPPLAFLGLGTMGLPMASNLARAGFQMTIWNRSVGRAQELAGPGVRVASSPAEAVRNAEVILYSLAQAGIEQVIFGEDGVLAGVRSGQLAINLSTVHPETSHREAAAYTAREVQFLDAPVFGSVPEALAAKLHIVVGGSHETYTRALPVLDALSASTHYMGATGNGSIMGLIGSLMVCLQLQALGEGLVLAQKAGLGVAKVVHILGLPDFRSPLFTGMGTGIIRRDFGAVFSLEHLYKDANQILQLAQHLDAPVPGCAVVRETIKGAINHGWGHENASALIKSLELQANVVVEEPETGGNPRH